MSDAFDPLISSGTIAVGVDDSESSHRALRWAAQEALRRHAAIEIITAWSWDSVEGTPLATTDPATMVTRAEQTQLRAITEVIDPMDKHPPITRRIVQASATEALRKPPSMPISSSSERTGAVRSGRFYLGSVSLSVIKRAACPVVVMPPIHTGETTGSGLATTRH
jgi:nucleotide-binding universal stress UspA family protein